MSGRRRARAHELLSVRTRTDILDRLRATSEPLDAHTIAQATGLHVTTVRFHLTALAKAGLVTAAPRRHPGRGRPRLMYSPVWDGDDGGGPYQELAELLAAHFDDTAPRRAERAERAGHTWAAKRL
ncbi:MAG TPA: helix-turn-helix domain-containing protein, partial [Thermopolyspora sp.]